jgi:hypothetical protein
MNGLNITRTFGYKPMLMTRVVKNFYSERNQETVPTGLSGSSSYQQMNNNQQPMQQQQQQQPPPVQPMGKRSINDNGEELKPILKRSRVLRQLYPNSQPYYPGQQTTPYPGQTSYPGQTTFPGLSYQPGQYPGTTQYPGQMPGQTQYPGQMPGQTQYPGQMSDQQYPGQPNFPGQMPGMNQSSSSSIYDMYSQGSPNRNQNYQGPKISLKLPQDEVCV